MRVIINSLEELSELAALITKKYAPKIIAFYGEMGSGKTTFIKSLCYELGLKSSQVHSPTFNIVNEYDLGFDQFVYHFDFYRIENENEAFDLGYENYFYSNHYCFIEWPEKISNLLPKNLLKIHIECEVNIRIFTIEEIMT